MESHCICWFFVPNIEKMVPESLCYGHFGLSYILFFAGFASDAVDHVRALASDVVLARVHHGCGSTFEGVPEQGTKLALAKSAFAPQRFGKEHHRLGLVDLLPHSLGQISRRTTAGDVTFLELCNGGLFGRKASGGPW